MTEIRKGTELLYTKINICTFHIENGKYLEYFGNYHRLQNIYELSLNTEQETITGYRYKTVEDFHIFAYLLQHIYNL